ncbi:contactin-2 [Ambystoma mexicanum]|uniref:contactin-2 n=1 Tax=Ambystoma mexicanum TaxID=8296 RepID=UPI0037E724E3
MHATMVSMFLSLAVFSLAVWCPTESVGGNYGPVFEEQPSNALFPEGSTEARVTLACRARASPPATYRWRMNGTDLHLDADTRYELVGGNLVIESPVKATDTGTYQCVATNDMGTVLSREAILRFGYLQEFPSTDERVAVKATEGWGVMIPCHPPPHYPVLIYRWLLNEFPKFVAVDERRFVSQVTGNLYIARAEAADQGGYACFATSHLDFVTKSVFSTFTTLNVIGDVNARQYAPSLKAKFPAETYALSGQTLTLECFAFGSPIPKIKWRKVDGALSPKWASTEPTLQITNVGFEDEGTYECEASNAKGRDTFQGRVIVQASPEWLKVITDTEANIGSNLHWSCAAAGKPRPTTRWLRNGQPLTSQERISVKNGEIRFSKLTLQESGMYQCIAENKHGIIYSSAELAVQALAPDFRLNPVKRLIPAARGGEVRIPCQPRAAPSPIVFWSKGTELLVNNTRVSIMLDGTLIIRNISRSDEGKYTCFAENLMGKANSTGTLSVRDATKITLAPTNADINMGDNVTLQCHASHDPTMDLSFTWSLQGLPIDAEKASGHYLTTTTNEAIGDLTVVHAQLKHAGKYTCTAQTVVDSTSESAILIVRGPPGPPGGVVVRDIGETTMRLSWSHGSDNHSPIAKYSIQYRSILANHWKPARTNPATIEGNAETAEVINLTPWMDYEFRVLASNILGVGEPSGPSAKTRTKEAAPTVAPSGLSGGGGAPNELIITWTPMIREYQNGDGFGYILAFRKQGTSDWQTAKVPAAESLHYVYRNESIAPYTPFDVKVRAYNRKGEGPESLAALVYSAEDEPRVAPSDVSATVLSASEMEVAWQAIEEGDINGVLQGYEIRYWKDGDKEAAADRVRTAGLETTARVSGLKPDTAYHVAVRAYNRAGTGPPSPSTNLTTTKAPPSNPPGNISWKLSSSSLSVKWDPVMALENESSVTGYKMLYRLDSQSAPTLYVTTKTRFDFPLPEDASHATVQIRATGVGGDGTPAEVHIPRDSGTNMMVGKSSASVMTSAAVTGAMMTLLLIGSLEH